MYSWYSIYWFLGYYHPNGLELFLELPFSQREEKHYDCLFVFCFDLGFHTNNPVMKYRPDASVMSYVEARAEMP